MAKPAPTAKAAWKPSTKVSGFSWEPMTELAIAARIARPSAPPTATPSASDRIDLAWTDNATNETGYVVERARSADFAGATRVSLPAGTTSYGGTIAGTPGLTTTWLRLAHRVDEANGEHEYRAGVSRDGRTWTWGGVWTLPADSHPRIGLIAHGGAEPAVTASFDYLRFRRW